MALCFRVDETNALPPEEVERLRRELSDNAWRQEMLCDFTAAADDVLISIDLATEAAGRQSYKENDIRYAPVVLGMDVARFGSDATVIFRRQGLVAFPPLVLRGVDNMTAADRLAQEIAAHRPAGVFIDEGQGQGVIDGRGNWGMWSMACISAAKLYGMTFMPTAARKCGRGCVTGCVPGAASRTIQP